MRTWQLRIVLAVLVLAVAAGGAALLMSRSDSTSDGDRGAGSAAKSDIWAVGDTWTVKVEQDSATISPDSTKSLALVPYRFRVEKAPTKPGGRWTVHVTQDGAEGPFKDGWRLTYYEKAGVMYLDTVAAGTQKPIEATVASIVLGSNFPYETEYASTPTDSQVKGADLAKRAAQPPTVGAIDAPTSSPGATSTESGAKPPANAPVLKAGEIPPGAPGSTR